MEVVLATSNPGKVREAQAILGAAGYAIRTVPLWLGELENGATFEENARLKAQSAMRTLRTAVLAEDAGIEVDALGGLPGVHSARFAGPGATAAENNAKLLKLLDGVPAEWRTARYRVTAILLMPSGTEVVAHGTLEGRLLEAPRGEAGFGYDPLFVPEGREMTVAEMPTDEKNLISHRARALGEIVRLTRTAGR